MKLLFLSLGWVCGLALLLVQPVVVAEAVTEAGAEETGPESFRDILELSGVDADALAQFGKGPVYNDNDWQLLLQVSNRLQQFRALQTSEPLAVRFPEAWRSRRESSLGNLMDMEGQILSVEKLPLPELLAAQSGREVLYRCRFHFLHDAEDFPAVTTVLTTQIPKAWQTEGGFSEKVRVRGVLLQMLQKDSVWQPLVLTNHLAWYPVAGVSTGQRLLSRYGMDVALLDEVRHRQPFVQPETSREGEAFYAALQAIGQSNLQEIRQGAQENVVQVAQEWQARQPELRRDHEQLQAKLAATTDPAARTNIQHRIQQAKRHRALAATVLKQAEAGQSSVAPMFLQPEKEVGELVVFEGTARRAVRIVVEQPHDLESYYELEVYPSESRLLDDQPVVCCVTEIPSGFPTGDEICEPVRISGVFFKLWRYRSRDFSQPAGQTTAPRSLYTQNPVALAPVALAPVVLAKVPKWLNQSVHNGGRWTLWAGIAFLVVLATLWIYLSQLAGRDRRARARLRQSATIDLPISGE